MQILGHDHYLVASPEEFDEAAKHYRSSLFQQSTPLPKRILSYPHVVSFGYRFEQQDILIYVYSIMTLAAWELLKEQRQLDRESAEVLHDNFWELVCR